MNHTYIIITLLGLLTLTLGVLYFREKRLRSRLTSQFHGIKDEDIIGNAKFTELGLMSAGIAHEINNPLTIIQARAQQLLRIYRNPGSEAELAKGLNQIVYTSDRIARTVRAIREFIYWNDDMPESSIYLSDILENALVFCGQRLKNHGIELRLVNIEKACLRGHRIQLEQVLLNLINNSLDAIDALPEKWIEISAVENKDTIDIFFKDSGNGIPVDIKKSMMEAFFTTKKGKGSGLGLTLVKGITEKHGGVFKYIENSDHTTFMLELPRGDHVFSH